VSTPRVMPLRDAPRRPDGRVALDAVVDRLRRVRPVHVLETVPGTPGAGRWSYAALSVGSLHDDGDGSVLALDGYAPEPLDGNPFAAIDRLCDRFGWRPETPRDPELPALTGGLVGVLGYDLARRVEHLPARAARDRCVADVDLAVTRQVVAVDHDTERAWLVETDLPGVTLPDLPVAELLAGAAATGDASGEPPRPAARPLTSSLPRPAYLRAVAAALEHIAAGDVFQVNLTQRLTTTWDGDVHALYRALRRESRAAFGAVVTSRHGAGVASVSPETFLHVDGARVRTRPIKGTRPRGVAARVDAALADDLATSAKDRAENVMVVDMERNDLGRVCRTGSVRVPRLLELEGHPTVWHLVSTVEGELRPGVGFGELLRAAFPCGSVTGTPKVRAMEIIDALEPVRRGVYCGAIGFLSAGAMSTSVAIRTASLSRDGSVDYGAGGGIVADSDPEAEHAESLDKAAAFLRAVGASGAGS
jgi:para-aminobenzoate synthetase component 1